MANNDKEKEFVNSTFTRLSQVDVNDKTEEKGGLTYLSWAWAFAEIFKRYPDTEYEVREFQNQYIHETENGALITTATEPFLFNHHLGYLISTSVTIEGVKRTMQLPVMDGANKAQRHVQYTYKGVEWRPKANSNQKEKVIVDKPVAPATMFDINTAIMRCLVKNFAMHGLGHYIYSGEDLPEDISAMIKEEVAQTKPEAKVGTVKEAVTTPDPEPVKQESPVGGKVPGKRRTKAEMEAARAAEAAAKNSAEMPDDSMGVGQPIGEVEGDRKKAFEGTYKERALAAKTHEDLFNILGELEEHKVLAIGTMHYGWKFKSLAEATEKMSGAAVPTVMERVVGILSYYNPA